MLPCRATDISGYISASLPQSLSTISADEHLRLNEALAERLLELAAQRNRTAQANTLLASSQILADYMSRAKGSLETELASVRDQLQEAEEAQGRLNSRLLSQVSVHAGLCCLLPLQTHPSCILLALRSALLYRSVKLDLFRTFHWDIVPAGQMHVQFA